MRTNMDPSRVTSRSARAVAALHRVNTQLYTFTGPRAPAHLIENTRAFTQASCLFTLSCIGLVSVRPSGPGARCAEEQQLPLVSSPDVWPVQIKQLGQRMFPATVFSPQTLLHSGQAPSLSQRKYRRNRRRNEREGKLWKLMYDLILQLWAQWCNGEKQVIYLRY